MTVLKGLHAVTLLFGLVSSTELSAQTQPPCSGSLSLSGQQYVEVSNAPALQPAKACTYDVWFRARVRNKSRILSKGDGMNSASNRSFDLTHDQNAQIGILAEFFMVQGSTRSQIWVHGPKLPLNRWTHVAATFDSVKRESILYVDGVQVMKGLTPQGATLYQSTRPFCIGATPPHAVYFNGEIKQARIWNWALPPQLIQAFMSIPSPNLPGLVAFWPLSGHLFDLTGGHDGTAKGRVSYVGGCGSWTNYHKGTPGPFGVPSWTLNTPPILGKPVLFQTDNRSTASAIGIFLLGTEPTSLPLCGGTLLVTMRMAEPLPISQTGAAWPINIPNDNALMGASLFTQLLVFYPKVFYPGWSCGLQLMVGNS